jgi:hypothetical protein
MIGYWLHKCWEEHPECQGPIFTNRSWPELPSRVLDLSSSHDEPFSPQSIVKVVETRGLKGVYCALSYRWPSKEALSRSTLRELSEGIPAGRLLSEIQDACTLAKGLGIQYLWVDALVWQQGKESKQELTNRSALCKGVVVIGTFKQRRWHQSTKTRYSL